MLTLILELYGVMIGLFIAVIVCSVVAWLLGDGE